MASESIIGQYRFYRSKQIIRELLRKTDRSTWWGERRVRDRQTGAEKVRGKRKAGRVIKGE